MLLLRRGAFLPAEIAALKDFCSTRGFDLGYCPGLNREETNRFNILDRPFFFESIRDFLSRERKESFYRDALFHISPPTDDRPFFFHFFRWKSLPFLRETIGTGWLPFVEWGDLILIAALVATGLLSLLLILAPLLILRGVPSPGRGRLWILYFLLIGLAYMLVEIALIQKFILFLGHPASALSVILFSLLLFSGLGSALSGRLSSLRLPVAGTVLLLLLNILFLGRLLRLCLALPFLLRALTATALLAPLGLLMGMFFPLGMRSMARGNAPLIPWAWGANGCASVAGSVFAVFLALRTGFGFLFALGGGLYLLAAFLGNCRGGKFLEAAREGPIMTHRSG